jgi:hypothetical protein
VFSLYPDISVEANKPNDIIIVVKTDVNINKLILLEFNMNALNNNLMLRIDIIKKLFNDYNIL